MRRGEASPISSLISLSDPWLDQQPRESGAFSCRLAKPHQPSASTERFVIDAQEINKVPFHAGNHPSISPALPVEKLHGIKSL